jgi:hypothetical protein
MMRVGALELQFANGRVKEAYQGWSRNTILPSAHPWRVAFPDEPNLQYRRKSWVEVLTSKGPKLPKPRKHVQTGVRYREPIARVEATHRGTKLRARQGKKKSQHSKSLTRHFLQASMNREKCKSNSRAAVHKHS